MAKNIVITGANGFLTSNLISKLDKNKYNITTIGISHLDDINIHDKHKINESIINSDVVIHLAAILNPLDEQIKKINVDYTKFLVDCAKGKNIKFIFTSTQNVLFGTDLYSSTKKEAEKIVSSLKNYTILRPTIIYGNKGGRYIEKLISLVKAFPLVPIMGNGSNKLQPIFLDDLINIIINSIDKEEEMTYLIAGPSNLSYNELVNIIIKNLKLTRIKIFLPLIFLRPFAFILQRLLKNPPITTIQLDNLKINKAYNIPNIEKTFNIKLTNIEEGLKSVLQRLKEQ